jgi:hypothetical protein
MAAWTIPSRDPDGHDIASSKSTQRSLQSVSAILNAPRPHSDREGARARERQRIRDRDPTYFTGVPPVYSTKDKAGALFLWRNDISILERRAKLHLCGCKGYCTSLRISSTLRRTVAICLASLPYGPKADSTFARIAGNPLAPLIFPVMKSWSGSLAC